MTIKRFGKSITIVLMVVAVLAVAFLLVSNLLPDQTYAAIQRVRRWAKGYTNAPLDEALLRKSPVLRREIRSSKSLSEGFVLLPSSEAREISTLCSRVGPKVVGTWQVSEVDTATLESRLSRIAELRSTDGLRGLRIAHPEACYRQYMGVIVAGRKLIYINVFCNIEVNYWHSHFVNICDGGDSVWGVLYDPASGDFSELTTNGIA